MPYKSGKTALGPRSGKGDNPLDCRSAFGRLATVDSANRARHRAPFFDDLRRHAAFQWGAATIVPGNRRCPKMGPWLTCRGFGGGNAPCSNRCRRHARREVRNQRFRSLLRRPTWLNRRFKQVAGGAFFVAGSLSTRTKKASLQISRPAPLGASEI